MELTEERLHADTFAKRFLTLDEFKVWNACRSGHRFMAYLGKELIIYKLFEGQPEIQDSLVCRGANLSLKAGLVTTWVTQDSQSIHVGHGPVQVHPGIFMWHVFDSVVQHTPYQGKYSTRLPLAYRMMRNPQIKENGITYILERSVYESTFGSK